MSLLAGHISQRTGAFRVLIAGIGMSLLGLGLAATSVGFATLAAGMVTLGFAGALIFNANATLLSDLFKDRIRQVMSFASALWFVVWMVASVVLGYWLRFAKAREWGTFSFRIPYLMESILILVCLVVVWRVLPRFMQLNHNPDAADEVSAKSPTPPAAPQRGAFWVVLLGLCHGVMMGPLFAWLSPLAQREFGRTDVGGSWLLSSLAFGVVTGRLVFIKLKLQWDERRILSVTLLGGGFLWFIAFMSGNYFLTLSGIVLGGALTSTSLPALPATAGLVARRFPVIKSKLYGYLEAGIGLAIFGSTTEVGALVQHGVPVSHALPARAGCPFAAWAVALTAFIWIRLEKRANAIAPIHGPHAEERT